MDFKLSEEHEMIRTMARDFADNEILPYCQEWDENHTMPWDTIKKLQELGLMTCGVPAEYGGPGIDHLGQAIISEEICRGDAGLGTTLAASTLLGPDPVYIAASDEQKKWWYGLMMEGAITAFCLTEPGAGSDAGGLSTRCVKDGDEYILNGTKQFISNGGIANLYTAFATLDKKMGYKGMCAFMVDRDTPGISIGPPENKLGIRTSNTTQVIFEDVRVPARNLLGKEGDGFKIAMKTLDISRAVVGAMATGVAQGAFEAAVAYSKERQQFGKPICTFQGKGGKPGKFELANGGTIFLDEIGEMSLAMQSKLLVVLQEQEIERLGGSYPIRVDVRVIAATNRKLERLLEEGEFREDLYYRLNVVRLEILPLRKRCEDIPVLIRHFMDRLNIRLKTSIKDISREGLELLYEYPWPGNVREMENVVERAMILADMENTEYLHKRHFAFLENKADFKIPSNQKSLKLATQEFERELIVKVLKETGFDRTKAAENLNIDLSSLYRKLKKHRIVGKELMERNIQKNE